MSQKIERPRRPLTESELREHLDEQLEFLESSAEAFDAGKTGEAKRMALTIRVLLHQTRKSHSLIDQLGMKATPFWNTSHPETPGNLLPHMGLLAMRFDNAGGFYVAPLDTRDHARSVGFDDWWTEVVISDGDGQPMTRQNLVIFAANQDGGGHIDPGLDEAYDNLTRKNSLGWIHTGEEGEVTSMGDAGRAAIRQIAHEVLRTLRPTYRRLPAWHQTTS
jgi:hypothetical protein